MAVCTVVGLRVLREGVNKRTKKTTWAPCENQPTYYDVSVDFPPAYLLLGYGAKADKYEKAENVFVRTRPDQTR